MTVPKPLPGLVIRYSFLWADEHDREREDGTKDRPCAVLLVVASEQPGVDRVAVLPITHSAPRDAADGIEIPAAVKRRLKLDDDRSWVILTEANGFIWPGPDLRRIDASADSGFVYGHLPPSFFAEVRRRFLDLHKFGRTRLISRTQ